MGRSAAISAILPREVNPMANHRTDERIELAPEAPARAEYERDFYSWLIEDCPCSWDDIVAREFER
jgi:hypothetical protein